MNDMTKGVEWKQILFFALPMLIGNIFQQLYNTVDGIIVGRFVGTEAQAAVGAAFPIMFLLVSLIAGVTMGATVLISQYYGAKDMDQVKNSIDTTYVFLFISTCVITALGLAITPRLLRLLQVPAGVFDSAARYLRIMFAGIIAMFGYNSVSAILRGLGDSKTPMYLLMGSTILNILLDLIFIIAFGMGVEGAAWATVIAQGASFIVSIAYLNRRHAVFSFDPRTMRFHGSIFRRILEIGLPTGFQQMLFSLGNMAIQGFVNGFGAIAMAGYFAGSRIDNFAAMPIMALGAAISTFSGQNLGAGKEERIHKGIVASVWMAVIASVTTSVILFVFRNPLVSIFTEDLAVLQVGADYLFVLAPFYAFIGTQFVLSGVLRGAGDTLVPMVISLVTLWLIRLPLAWFLSPKMGVAGIWWGIPVGWIIGFLLTVAYYKSGRWKKIFLIHARESEKEDGAEISA
jgi:putative MATE family efflux protein